MTTYGRDYGRMKKVAKEESQLKLIFAGSILVLIAVLIPLFIIGHYNFQSIDDVGYAGNAEVVWQETHSAIKTFAGQVSYAINYWKIWQGTFAAEWFSTSVMGIFVNDAYYMGTYISLGSFVLAELFLFMLIMKKGMGADTSRAGIVSICVICLQVLMTTVPVEAFYWFCGSSLYTVTYSTAAVLCGLLILLYGSQGKAWKCVLLSIGIFLLSFLVSGGTYATLIGMFLVYFFATLWFWYRKNKNRWIATSGMAIYMAGFLLNVLAPGNQKRLTASNAASMSALDAIFTSLIEAAKYVWSTNARIPALVLGVLFLPLFINIARQRKYKYSFPVLVTFISFGMFAAQFTPTLYTLGMTGPGRILNVYRWTFFIWFYANELYWVGWILRKRNWGERREEEKKCKGSYLLLGWIIGGIFLCFELYRWGGDTLTTVSAVNSLRRGEAQTYYAEYQERLKVLQDDSIKEVQFAPYSSYPYLLFFGDITFNTEDWVNGSLAEYYNKDSVVLIRE